MDQHEEFKDEQCPVCGYYCLGKGRMGCINKPALCGISGSQETETKNLGTTLPHALDRRGTTGDQVDKPLIKFAAKVYIFVTVVFLCLGGLAWLAENLR